MIRLIRSWQLATAHGDQLPLRFYAHLFVTHPETRDLFPLSMAAQRDRLVGALGHIVSRVADIDALLPFVQQLGRDHRKFGVSPEHYTPVGQALLATLAELLGDEWTPQLEKDWTAAYELVARLMTEAASEAETSSPPWWDAQVERHERRTLDIAVLTLRPEPTYAFLPGQSAAGRDHPAPTAMALLLASQRASRRQNHRAACAAHAGRASFQCAGRHGATR